MANGLSDEVLDYASFRASVKRNEETAERALSVVLAEIAPGVAAAPAHIGGAKSDQ